MLLIFEVALTIAAWKNGWGPRALLPGVIGFAVVFVVGFVLAASNADVHQYAWFEALVDIGALIILGVMSRNAPAANDAKAETEAEAEAAARA